VKVIFSHGKESGPWGTKIKRLAEVAEQLACTVESIDYQGITDADKRVKTLVDHLQDEQEPYILVGSSMGGYVACMAAQRLHPVGLFLLAPALYMPGYTHRIYPVTQKNVCIVHAWKDEIIPWQNIMRFARENQSELHMLHSDHRLVSVLDDICNYFSEYLIRLL